MLSFLSACAKIIGSVGLISVLARVFTLAEFGEFTYALTLATVFSLVVDYGYNMKVIKDVSSKGYDIGEVTALSFATKGILFLGTFCCVLLSNNVLSNSVEVFSSAIFLFLALITFSFTNTLLSVFKGEKQYDKDLKVVVLDNLATFLIVSIVAYYTRSIVYASLGFFLTKVLAFLFALGLYLRKHNLVKPTIKAIKNDLVIGFPYAIHYWVGSVYLNIDTIIMETMVSADKIGLYQSGIRIVIGLGILLTVINAVYLPTLNHNLAFNKKEFESSVKMLNKSTMLLAVLVCGSMIIFSKLIIQIVFGSSFIELDTFFWVFAIIVGIRIIGVSYGILLTISNKQKLRAIAGGLSIVLIVIFDLYLIPRKGYTIAAYVLLFAHIFITGFYMISVKLEYNTFFVPKLKDFFSLKLN